MNLADLAAHRQEILWWEIASLLHDIGKLSDDFLYYRQHWHAMPKGYHRDPHDKGWYKSSKSAEEPLGDTMLFNDFPNLAEFFEAKGVSLAVNEHTNQIADRLLSLLKIGDATDSRYDRNNPLAGSEQTNHSPWATEADMPEMFRSNVFGYEGESNRIIRGMLDMATTDPLRPIFNKEGILNKARRALYSELDKTFSRYYKHPDKASLCPEQYKDVRDLLKTYFEPAMSDSTRPCNDTSLWEHVYSVASVTKALHAKQATSDHFQPAWNSVELFRLWGFGFDALRYLSSAHKIGDILGRRRVLEFIFDASEELLQYTYPLGNAVYRDDNCIFFLVADLPELLGKLQELIVAKTKEFSLGELVPHFAGTEKAGRALTDIARCIDKLRQDLATPVSSHAEAVTSDAGKVGSVCPICRLRAIPFPEPESKVCDKCMDRRRRSAEEARQKGQTPYLSEIVDKSGRAALIVAKFGLEDWLSGRLVRTTLITEPHGAEHMLAVFKHFKEEEHAAEYLKRKAWIASKGTTHNYTTMLAEFRKCLKPGDPEYENSAFLYGRAFKPQGEVLSIWEETRQELNDELGRLPREGELFNAVCAKTPTPSTVLDVWDTTLEFLENVAEPLKTYATEESAEPIFQEIKPFLETLEHDDLKRCPRGVITVVGDFSRLNRNDVFDTASIDGKPVEAIYLGDSRFGICRKPYQKDWEGKKLKLDDTQEFAIQTPTAGTQTEQAYWPFREISASPDMLLLIVPASAAVDVTRGLYKRYLEQFGKVYGRLPFSIGNIFFPQYLPMFSVLDAARRMERNFAQLHRQPRLLGKLVQPKAIKMKLGAESDADAEDYYHPYVLTKEKHPETEGYFETIAGPMVSMRANPGDALLYPNYYDCVWLGSSADRLRIHVNSTTANEADRTRLRELVARPRGGDGPILLDEFCDRVVDLWIKLKNAPGVTDSHIRNFETLMEDRQRAWASEDPVLASTALNGLSSSLLHHYLPESLQAPAEQAYQEGLLTFTLKLYLHILKEDLKESA